tara:strand:+ start:2747 stop:3991 length:1245 start_codon:yes stop_codon:yes gene_type:complete
MDLARSTTGITTNAYETFAASKAYLDTRVRDTVCDHFGGTTVSKCELARRGVWVGEGAARIQTVTPKEINAAYATERGARKATNGLKARACCYYSHSVSIKRLAALLRAQFPTLPEDVCKKHALRYMREVKEASPLGTNKTSNDDIDNKTTVYDDTRDAQGQRIKPGGIDRAGRRKGTEGCTDVNSHYFVFMGYQIAAAPADAPAAAPATAEGSGGPPEVAAFIVPDGVDSPQPAASGAGVEDADTDEDDALDRDGAAAGSGGPLEVAAGFEDADTDAEEVYEIAEFRAAAAPAEARKRPRDEVVSSSSSSFRCVPVGGVLEAGTWRKDANASSQGTVAAAEPASVSVRTVSIRGIKVACDGTTTTLLSTAYFRLLQAQLGTDGTYVAPNGSAYWINSVPTVGGPTVEVAAVPV